MFISCPLFSNVNKHSTGEIDIKVITGHEINIKRLLSYSEQLFNAGQKVLKGAQL